MQVSTTCGSGWLVPANDRTAREIRERTRKEERNSFFRVFSRISRAVDFQAPAKLLIVQERLQKLIAQAGLASRRGAEELITEGIVTVNGKVAVLGTKADPETDHIKVRGKLINVRIQSKEN